MRGVVALLLLGAAPLAPAMAQDADVVSIADVIRAFKAEVRDVQVQSRTACTFSVEKADFTFLAETRSENKGGAQGTFEVFGIKIGASAETSEGQTETSTIKVSFEPRAGRGLEEVGGSAQRAALQGFGDLIRNTKAQIEASARDDDSLQVREIVIETDFKIERDTSGKLNVIVTGETGLGQTDKHHVVLTLGPASEGKC
jgi:hypothetical protein